MGATIRAIFYTIAVLCFAVAAFAPERFVGGNRLNVVAAAAGVFVFVSAWDAWALA
jgi:hypothetical protein